MRTTRRCVVSSGGSGAYHDAAVSPDARNEQFFGRFDFDLTDNLHFYVDGGYSTATLTLTESTTGGIVGTPSYMAPEQFEGRPATPRTEIGRAHV